MHILIADDEPIIRMGLRAMLQEMGHTVTAANDGREALQQLRRHAFDLVILDVKMPYTDGLQAAQTISRTTPLPILLLTAFSEADLIERAANLPIHGYLVKPIRPDQLAAAMAIAVRRFADTQALQQQTAELSQKLAARQLIDQAKQQLMASGLSEEEAYRTIQQRARHSRQSMEQVAQEILKQTR